MQGERKGKSKRKSKCDKREGRGDHQREGSRGDQCRGKAAEIKRSGVSQRANPQNQNLRKESIFKGNDISKSSKVQQDQHFERAKADSGPRSEVSRRANSQDRNSRQTSIFKGHGTSTSSKGVYETDQEESILPKHMVEQLEM